MQKSNYFNDDFYKILPNIKNPKDLKKLSDSELEDLCKEIRKKILITVSKNGGHLASNLGVVELTVALHKKFNSPQDKIIWDTGHQGYAHKLLTGRFNRFLTLKEKDGVGAFVTPFESEHDVFIAGHSSISLSVACGIAKSELLKKTNNYVIAVIGDGALTGGIAYEALNNAFNLENLIIILNCNDMSISKTVGSFSKYITNIRSNKAYISMNIVLQSLLEKTPLVGEFAKNTLKNSKEKLKKILYKSNIFSDLGYSFLNFVDGHNIKELEKAMTWAKKIKKPAIIQVFTKKGKGYLKAEKNPELYHGVGPFNLKTGVIETRELDFSKVFGREILKLAAKDSRICTITAAMGVSTGLFEFKNSFPERYFDVGIAEEHAVTFAAALSKGGFLPVFAVYSTFLQRSYDQLVHDVAIQNLHVVLAIDRAGVGDEGPTHQGVLDVCFLTTIPNVTIYSAATYEELRVMLKKALYEEKGLVAVRYSKGVEIKNLKGGEEDDYFCLGEGRIAIITYGTLFEEILKAQDILQKKGIFLAAFKLNKIFPISDNIIEKLKEYEELFFFEEGMKNGGIGEHLILKLIENGFNGNWHLKAIDGVFISQAKKNQILENLGLDEKSIAKYIAENLDIT